MGGGGGGGGCWIIEERAVKDREVSVSAYVCQKSFTVYLFTYLFIYLFFYLSVSRILTEFKIRKHK